MESGNYSTFHTDNRQRLEQCAGGTDCEAALFNLGFVYAYPQSPYYNPAKALEYFDELAQNTHGPPGPIQGERGALSCVKISL